MNKPKRQPTGDYAVGYAKPPEANRFKPGQSGNPRGRSKGNKNLNTYLLEEAKSLVALNNGDITVKMPKSQALAKTAMNKALRGDMRAIVWMAAKLMEAEREQPGESTMSDEDQTILDMFLKRHGDGGAS